ncbi:MAG: QueT transporter family protein [Clostridiales bacterium]|nr:QueT transporter family protein [Clostridiales bacterium]
MKNKKVFFIVQAAMIAAIYVVLTFIANSLGLASGAIQVRLSEALTILPFFLPAAIPGLFVGCLLSNLLTGGILIDVIFGSLTTLLAAFATYALRKQNKFLAPVPPIIANTLVVPFILVYGYGISAPIWSLMATVGAGEIISCGVLGMALLFSLEKQKKVLFS